MGRQQFIKTAAWTLLAGSLVGVAGLAVSSERGNQGLREVQVKKAEHQARKPVVEAAVALGEDPGKAPQPAAQAEKPAAPAQVVEGHDARLKALREQKLKLMRDGAAQSLREFQFARADLREVIEWQVDLHKAELYECTNDKERVDVWTRALAEAKEIEQKVQAKRQFAQASPTTLMRATAYRLDVEIALERLNSK